MPKRGAAALTLTGLALALLLNFRTPSAPTVSSETGSAGDGGTAGTAAGSGGSSSGTSGSSGSSGTSGASGSGSNGSSASGGSSTAGTTFDGAVVDTRYGPVQVEITVANGRLADVTALQLPDQDRRSASISSRAEPILRSEALAAGSAAIDGVSGATYTSSGYEQSLQAALDAAGI